MHAVMVWLQAVVAAMVVAAFAQFGISLRDGAPRQEEPTVQRVSEAAAPVVGADTPCPKQARLANV